MAVLRLNFVIVIPILLSVVSARNMGSINVDGVGPIYVVAPDWAAEHVSVYDNGFTLSGGGRVYFAKDPVDDFSNPFAYWQTPLIGNYLSYDIGNFCPIYSMIILLDLRY